MLQEINLSKKAADAISGGLWKAGPGDRVEFYFENTTLVFNISEKLESGRKTKCTKKKSIQSGESSSEELEYITKTKDNSQTISSTLMARKQS